MKEITPLMLKDDDDGAHASLDVAILHVKASRLLARIYKESGKMSEAVTALERARNTQNNILARVRIEAVEQVKDQQEEAAALSLDLGQHLELAHDLPQAQAAYE